MLDQAEIIDFYTSLKHKSSKIKNPALKRRYILGQLNKYSLSEWAEIGNILRNANLI